MSPGRTLILRVCGWTVVLIDGSEVEVSAVFARFFAGSAVNEGSEAPSAVCARFEAVSAALVAGVEAPLWLPRSGDFEFAISALVGLDVPFAK